MIKFARNTSLDRFDATGLASKRKSREEPLVMAAHATN
jgi:hypothetical protein